MAHLLKEAIRSAAMVGDLAEVQRLIGEGAPVHDTDFTTGNTAIHYAGANGHSDVVEALLKAKPDSVERALKTRNKKGKTALEMAKAQGIKTALSSWQPPPKPPPGPAEETDAGAPLRAATDRGDLGEVIRLIREGADVNAPSAAGFAPLHCACARAVVDCVEELLKRGGNPGALNSTGATPLHYAAGSKKADSVRLLLEDDWTGGKCPLEALDKDGKSALRWALEAENIPAATLLAAKGADPYKGSPPLPALPVPPEVADAIRSRLANLRVAVAGTGDGGEANMPREALALLRARKKRAAAPGAAVVAPPAAAAGEEAAAAAAAALEKAVVVAEETARAAVVAAERAVARIDKEQAAAAAAAKLATDLAAKAEVSAAAAGPSAA